MILCCMKVTFNKQKFIVFGLKFSSYVFSKVGRVVKSLKGSVNPPVNPPFRRGKLEVEYNYVQFQQSFFQRLLQKAGPF
jgi:hypothetical protein